MVTYWCGDAQQAITVVYDVDGGDTLQVTGASLLAADEDHVLLGSQLTRDDLRHGVEGSVYLLDLDRRTLGRTGPELHDAQVDLAGGLVLSNQPGPDDAKNVYDVVWNVARLAQHD